MESSEGKMEVGGEETWTPIGSCGRRAKGKVGGSQL